MGLGLSGKPGPARSFFESLSSRVVPGATGLSARRTRSPGLPGRGGVPGSAGAATVPEAEGRWGRVDVRRGARRTRGLPGSVAGVRVRTPKLPSTFPIPREPKAPLAVLQEDPASLPWAHGAQARVPSRLQSSALGALAPLALPLRLGRAAPPATWEPAEGGGVRRAPQPLPCFPAQPHTQAHLSHSLALPPSCPSVLPVHPPVHPGPCTPEATQPGPALLAARPWASGSALPLFLVETLGPARPHAWPHSRSTPHTALPPRGRGAVFPWARGTWPPQPGPPRPPPPRSTRTSRQPTGKGRDLCAPVPVWTETRRSALRRGNEDLAPTGLPVRAGSAPSLSCG